MGADQYSPPQGGVGVLPVLSKPAMADSSGGGGVNRYLVCLRCFTPWHSGAFQTPPGFSWGRFRPPNVPRSAPNSNKKNEHVRKTTQIVGPFCWQMSALRGTNKGSNTCKMSWFGRWNCPQWKLLPDPSHLLQAYPEAPKRQ